MMVQMKTGKRPAPQNDQKIRLVLILSFSLLCFMFFHFTYTQTIRLANLKGIVQYENQTTIASNQSEAIGRPPEISTVLLPPEPEGPRIAICLVGGARRFELTGISLLERVVNVFNNSDLFLHSPLDQNSFKLMLLRDARSIAAVQIFKQKPLPETKEQRVVLRDGGSPNGVQIEVREPDIPFCVVTERRFAYPPDHHGVPVASMGSRTPLSGSYCRPCNPACNSTCFAGLLKGMLKYWNWIYGEPELCDGSGPWETDWEQCFDRAVGEKYANIRKQFGSITLEQCISDLESMKSRTSNWDALGV